MVTLVAVLAGLVPRLAAADPGTENPFHLALEGALSTTDRGRVIGEADLGLAYRLGHIAPGLSIGGATAALPEGQRAAFTVTPTLELSGFLGNLQPFMRFGLPLQTRSGAGMPATAGYAVYGAAGLRLWTLPVCEHSAPETCFGRFTVSYEVRYQQNLSGGYMVFAGVLPAGTGIVSSGFSLGWEL